MNSIARAPASNLATGQTNGDNVPRLAMRSRDAARSLGISERLLWGLTQKGEVPCIRLGRAVVYSVDALRRWLDARAQPPPAASANGTLVEQPSSAPYANR
jgi:predicted DNA-binding transcriptional regulator AlpA